MQTAVMWVGRSAVFYGSVHLFLYMISQKPMQLRSPNPTQAWINTSPENPFISGSKRKITRHKKQCWHGSWHSCECWLLLGTFCFLRCIDNDRLHDGHSACKKPIPLIPSFSSGITQEGPEADHTIPPGKKVSSV